MGTIAEKGAYLNTTKSLLKQKINNLGGDITDETTFREYANQLQNVYDNLPKTEYQEGTEVTIENGLKGKLDYENGVVGIGQNSQESTQGYQLLDINITGATLVKYNNGFKLTKANNRTGRISLSQTHSAGTYTLSMKQVSHVSSQTNYFYVALQNYNGSSYIGILNNQIINNSNSITMDAPEKFNTLYFFIANNETDTAEVTVDDVMLESGSTAHDWEPYTGGQASPNPSYEQEIKYVRGKNFFGFGESAIDVTSTYRPTANQRLTVTGIGLNEIRFNFRNGNYSRAYLEIDGIDGTQDWAISFIIKENTTSYTPTMIKDTTNSTSNKLIFIVNGNNGSTSVTDTNYFILSNIQVEKGSTSTPYLPYNTIEEIVRSRNYFNLGGSPPTSLTDLDVSLKNASCLLFDTGGEAVTEGGYIYDNNSLGNLGTFKAGDYTIGIKFVGQCSVESNCMATHLTDVSGVPYVSIANPVITNGTTYVKNFTLAEETQLYYKLYTNTKSKTFSNTEMRVMIYEGTYTTSTLPNWEVYYTPTSYQLSLGDKKLYDECYIAGTPNNWKYVDNMYKTKLKDIQLYSDWSVTQNNNLYYFWFLYESMYDIPKGKMLDSDNNLAPILSNYFGSRNVLYNVNTEKNVIVKNTLPTSPMFIVAVDSEIASSVAEWKNYIANHEDLYIVYSTKEPLETPITDETLISQLNAWYNAQSLNGTTIITSNGDLPMIVKVRALKSA